MKETITVTITEDAETTVEVGDVKGKGCTALTEALEKALGKKIKDTPTREMHEREVQHDRRVIRS